VAARSAALEGCGPSASAVALRGSALRAEHLRVTEYDYPVTGTISRIGARMSRVTALAATTARCCA
jgi:hypothetical protein